MAQGPQVDKLIFIIEGDEAKAVRNIIDGRMHIWLYYLRSPENVELAKARGLTLINVAGCGVYDLQVNPVTMNGTFNPFAIREVREALNWLIDRSYIAQELMKGMGLPQYTPFRVGSPEYVRYIDLMVVYERKYSYNFKKASEVITEALKKAGAVLRDGKWYYGDKPIVIKIIARSEDVRRDIGVYVAEQLKKLGFEVDIRIVPSRVAVPIVYRGDPRKGEWHIYTEGFAYTGGITGYEDDNFAYYYTSPFSGTILNTQYSDYAREKIPPEFKKIAERLAQGDYKSLDERRQLVEKALEYAMKESVRVWLVTQKCPMPAAPNIEAPYDLMGGFWTRYALRAIKFTDRKGGEVVVGQLTSFFTEPWNPFNNWLYDQMVLGNVYDTGIWVHPHTGKYTSLRAQFKVETAGPTGTLEVPPDAVKPVVVGPEPGQVEWRQVGSGVKAISHIIWTIPKGYWHYSILPEVSKNNVAMTIADVLYSIGHVFQRVNNTTKIYDPGTITPATQTFVEKLVGLKIEDVGANIVVHMWVNYWHPDTTYIVQYFDPVPWYPWELAYLMDYAVATGKLAWVVETAQAKNIEVLDLAKGPSIDILKRALDEVKGKIPQSVANIVKDEEAKARWSALETWYSKMKHFYVSNGPYYIERVDTQANQVVLAAFRDYPFSTAEAYTTLYKPRVPVIEILDIITTVPAGLPITATLGATLEGSPYNDVTVRFILFNATGGIAYSGEGSVAGAGRFYIEVPGQVTAKLKPGVYTLNIIAVGADAAVPVLFTRSIVLTPAAEQLIEEVSKRVGEQFTTVEKGITNVATSVNTLSDKISQLSDTLTDKFMQLSNSVSAMQASLNITNGLLALLVILIIVNLVLALRRKGATSS
ncbi:MAG: ABC transporter substrate-binding protein [Infirmifilum sp.]